MSDILLHGEFHLRLDDKCRLQLPKGVRQQMATSNSTALIARGSLEPVQSSVWLFPEQAFVQLCDRREIAEDVLGFDLRMFDLAVCSRLTCDKRGRTSLPEAMLSYYGIHAPDVTLLGVNNHFELWSR